MHIAVFQYAAELLQAFRRNKGAGGEAERLHDKGILVELQSIVQFFLRKSQFPDTDPAGSLYLGVHKFSLKIGFYDFKQRVSLWYISFDKRYSQSSFLSRGVFEEL